MNENSIVYPLTLMVPVQPSQPIFKTMPLTAQDWMVVVGLGVMPLIIVEFVKLVNSRLGRT